MGSGDTGVQKPYFRDFMCFRLFLRTNFSNCGIRILFILNHSMRLFKIEICLRQHFYIAPCATEVSAAEVDPFRVYRVFEETVSFATTVSQ